MKNYEINLLYLSNEKDFQESKKEVLDLFKEHKIEILSEEDTGIKDIAYPIEKNTRGHYYCYKVKSEESSIKPLRKDLNLKEKILRFLIIHLDKKALKYFEDIKKKPLNLVNTGPGGWQSPSSRKYHSRASSSESDGTNKYRSASQPNPESTSEVSVPKAQTQSSQTNVSNLNNVDSVVVPPTDLSTKETNEVSEIGKSQELEPESSIDSADEKKT